MTDRAVNRLAIGVAIVAGVVWLALPSAPPPPVVTPEPVTMRDLESYALAQRQADANRILDAVREYKARNR